jgi:hypothetical protein
MPFLRHLVGAGCLCLTLVACNGRASRPAALKAGDPAVKAPNVAESTGTNVIGHPLKHPEFRMITAPQGAWNTHWRYPNDVMSYLLKQPADAALARRVLAAYGLGQGDKSYLFVAREGAPLVVNGNLFKTRQEAVEFIKKEKLSKLLYVPENNAFPTQIPVWLDQEGIQVWVLKWQRQ